MNATLRLKDFHNTSYFNYFERYLKQNKQAFKTAKAEVKAIKV